MKVIVLFGFFAALCAAESCRSDWEVRQQGKDLELRDGHVTVARVVLRPDGSPWLSDVRLGRTMAPVIGRMSLFWWQYRNNEQPGRSVNIVRKLDGRIEGNGISVQVSTVNRPETASSEYRVSLTRDCASGGYIVAFDTTLTVARGAEWVVSPQGGVEFTDVYWPAERVVPHTVPFPGARRAVDWDRLLYRDRSGGIRRIALNHADSADKFNISLARQGSFVGMFGHPADNAIFEFDDETAAQTFGELCAYSYDLHLLRRLDSRRNLDALISPAQHYTGNYQYTLKSNESVRARFRLRSAKPRETEDWMRTSAVLPIPDEWFAPWVRPVYEPINKFREALRHRDVDPRWYWETDTPHVAEWDRSIGYDDRGSLRITNRAPSDVGEWKVALGREFFGEPFEPRTEYVLSAQVLVKGTPSARAVLGFAFGQAANAQWLAEANSRDRREWQTLSVTIPQQERGASRGYILLRLLDVGTVWFDNVRLKKGRVAPGRR